MACRSESHTGDRIASFDDLEQFRAEGPLASAPVLVEPDAEQLARPVIVRSQHRHHRPSGPEDHLVTGFRFLSAHKPPLLSNLQIRSLSGRKVSEGFAPLYALAVEFIDNSNNWIGVSPLSNSVQLGL